LRAGAKITTRIRFPLRKRSNGVFSLKVSYDGGQHATAVNEPHHNVVAIDCPFTGKGEEFSPGSLLALSVAS
jgi:uncharacterized OsmC-like protein